MNHGFIMKIKKINYRWTLRLAILSMLLKKRMLIISMIGQERQLSRLLLPLFKLNIFMTKNLK